MAEPWDITKLDAPGFFDSSFNSNASVLSTPQSTDIMSKYAGPMALGGTALQGFAKAWAGEAQIDNIFTNVSRLRANIDQMAEFTEDKLEIQARKVSRRTGAIKARIGASGLGMEGSPLLVMADAYGKGMQDFEAIKKAGEYQMDNAYAQIVAELDRAKDIGKSMIVGGIQTAASGAFQFNAFGMKL